MSEQSRTVFPDIIYTKVDEAPELARASLLPIVAAYLKKGGIVVGTKDISLAGRIIAAFSERMGPESRQEDDLALLGEWVTTKEANVIKLPNISASLPQLKGAIRELQGQGYSVPDYPEQVNTPEEREIRARYDAIKGSAVNPVLREGNSDRRVPRAVKEYARRNPHSMGVWHRDSRTRVATMAGNDFFANERSVIIAPEDAGAGRILYTGMDGRNTVLKAGIALHDGAVVDATFLGRNALVSFLQEQITAAREEGLLFSIHLKATMMKVSDPVIFGHAVALYLREVFERHEATLAGLGVDPKNGIGDLLARIKTLPADVGGAIEADVRRCLERSPPLYMVDSDRGITNLHVPSDVIIDASMPALIRAGGKGWGPDGQARDTLCVIPDSSYAGVYRAAIEFCKRHGAFDPATMGSVANVGLMAQQAEEYGSHGTTFVAPGPGTIEVVASSGRVLLRHEVGEGDLWRLCRTRDEAIRDWVRLAVERARLGAMPAIFWLDEHRAHDACLIAKVRAYLQDHDISGLDLSILPPEEATRISLDRCRKGKDTISVTGNVLRDYNTDLFPILEVGTSAKMLSIVPLMNGGGLFETGAGGSAPKHVRQFVDEGHLRWDSLGEFAALAASLEHLSLISRSPKAALMARTLDQATGRVLLDNRSPSPRTGELDNRGSHFFLALYWAEALAKQDEDPELKTVFAPFFDQLNRHRDQILAELNAVQGRPVDLGGYFHPDPDKLAASMRPSPTFNALVASL
ncbi:MAG: NADP-dependent isocitrate dehydrogenase [Magnetococcales bacterium]|nr:NADP-dependent isocitrate dehydrogenase [Magnetococcales bacterium]